MIIDTLDNFRSYTVLNKHFAALADFLEKTDLNALPDGRCDVLPDGVIFANVGPSKYRAAAEVPFEYHRKYVDVQVPLEIDEVMGWMPLADFPAELQYDGDRDVAIGPAAGKDWVTVRPGQFIIFLPTDAHAPCIGEGTHRKIIFKILAD